MQASRHVRAAGTLGRLLLLVVLALGVFIMHTMGHPDDCPSMSMSMSSASHASATVHDGHAEVHKPGVLSAHASAVPSRAEKPARPAPAHPPLMAMNMLSLCVAVMTGAWVLAALVRPALTRRPARPADLLARAHTMVPPNPPPRGPDLTRLSVLRL